MRPKLRLHGMDGMRALAALAIVILHVYSYTALKTMGEGRRAEYDTVVGEWTNNVILQSAIRTDIFFVLSGLLLALPFVRWLLVQGETRPSLRRFARNRLRRIWPLYLLVMLVAACTISIPFAGIRNVVVNGLLIQNLVPEAMRIVPVSWTLCVEIGFYVALPLVMLALAPVLRRIPQLWVRASILSALCASTVLVGNYARMHPKVWLWEPIPGPTTLDHLDAFGAGIFAAVVIITALASASSIARTVRRLPALVWTLPATALVLVALVARWRGIEAGLGPNHHSWWASLAAIGIAGWLLAMSLRPDTSWLARITGSPLLTSIGLLSYGLFLWHFIVLRLLSNADLLARGGMEAVVINALLVFGITVPLSWATWHLVERPFLEGRVTLPRPRITIGQLRPVAERKERPPTLPAVLPAAAALSVPSDWQQRATRPAETADA